MRVGEAKSQLNQPSLTSLSLAGCGRLQLGVVHWATLVALLQVVDDRPHSILLSGTPGHRALYLSLLCSLLKSFYS